MLEIGEFAAECLGVGAYVLECLVVGIDFAVAEG